METIHPILKISDSRAKETWKMDDFLQKFKKVTHVVIYGPAISQSDCRRAGLYQLPYNNIINSCIINEITKLKMLRNTALSQLRHHQIAGLIIVRSIVFGAVTSQRKLFWEYTYMLFKFIKENRSVQEHGWCFSLVLTTRKFTHIVIFDHG